MVNISVDIRLPRREPMSYRPYLPPTPLLFGYDPVRDLPPDHLARLVEQVVEASVTPPRRRRQPGQPAYDPRLSIKVLVYGYATGQRSSRQLERLCGESLPYLFLTRGDTPSYRTLCTVRVEQGEAIEAVWVSLFAVAQAAGLKRLGHIVVDSTKLRANASPEAVLEADEYAAVRQELAQILVEAAATDTAEEQEGRPGNTRLGQEVPKEQMREILRRVRKRLAQEKQAAARKSKPGKPLPAAPPEDGSAPPTPPEPTRGPAAPAAEPPAATEPRLPLGTRMVERLEAALVALDEAMAEGRAHLCLTDPDARMMAGGREKQVRECHSFEVAVDREDGLLVVGQTTQATHDNERLEPLIAAAAEHEPEGVKAADGDCGFYSGDAIARLIADGIDVCVPDSNTAGDLHRDRRVGTTRERGQEWVELVYDAAANCYRCPEGNELHPSQQREHGGQFVWVYRAQRDCTGCPRTTECLRQAKAKRRTVKVGPSHDVLEADRQRFNDPAHRERYRHRGEAVETVFGFVRGVLGYTRWLLRGAERVACEGKLIKTGYQLRKVHGAWARAVAG
jgi:transposase